MKITANVDCTPEEARRFLGLPDLTPVHEAYVERMTKLVTDGTSTETFGELATSGGPMSEASVTMWRHMMENVAGKR